ncbi:T9SS type A sorting domain-containing protein [Rufibacter psychrotolerans]|uniref:T9SS type A sorting domain-containing protein n=1 Tax=Rufibacter psychrotolerans TaxID=2812556 RepID=UPI0019678E0D|nr:T9SS type A sorting domain-containing protein [Rufibacter sp. SYSU D00308]
MKLLRTIWAIGVMLICSGLPSLGQTVVKGEYFFNTDPGQGRGKPLTLSPSGLVDITAEVGTEGLASGFHTLFVRFQDQQGRWGLSEGRTLLVETGQTGTGTTLTRGEYFFDTDPGKGKGKALSVGSRTGGVIDVTAEVDAEGLADGFHTLFVRFQDRQGVWGLSEGRTFLVERRLDPASTAVVKGEYFFDSDPGLGKGKALPVAAGGLVDITAEVSTEGLSPGFHTLFVRIQDREGRWGMGEGRTVLIERTQNNSVTITAAEYFFDNANPEHGKGTPLPVNRGAMLELETQVDVSGLALGRHSLHLRLLDDKGVWSQPEIKEFTVANPRLDAVTPAIGGNAGDVTINLLGAAFDQETRVKLTRAGQPDILVPDSMVTAFNGDQLQAVLNLRGKPIGEYDVVVTMANGVVLAKPKSFTIVEGISAHPWAEVLGFDRIRIGQWQTYTLAYGNKGNVDAHGVPLYFAVSDKAELKIDFAFEKPYESFNVKPDAIYDSIPDYIVVDTLMGYTKRMKLVSIYVPSIPGNSTNTLSFRVKVDSSEPIEVFAWAGEPLFGSPLKGWASECLDNLFDMAAGLHPIANCLNNAFNTGYQLGNVINKAIEKESWGYLAGGVFLKMPAVIVSNTLDCALSPVKAIDVSVKMLKAVIKVTAKKTGKDPGSSSGGGQSGLGDCLPPPEPPKPPRPIQPVASFDPNDKVGLEGTGPLKFITGSEVFPYLIRFENKASASASAQTVRIVDTLDMNTLDISTLQLGFFNFDDVIVNVPPGRKNYSVDVDLRPKNNLIVRIEAKLDEQKGILTWLYTSLDPATLLPTEDPDAGFLPPNKTAPQGEGGVFYTIKPKADLPTDAEIRNRAYIFFDNNEVIPTPTWANSVDKTPPVSKVKELPKTQSSAEFRVEWSGSDEGSGVATYSIYVSVNGTPYKPWLDDVATTTALYQGKQDSTYQFYSIATDSAGHEEQAPVTADASTTVATITGLEEEIARQVAVYPNPASHTLVVELPQQLRRSSLSLVDMTGRIKMEILAESTSTSIPISRLPRGMYLLRISNGQTVVTKKVLLR